MSADEANTHLIAAAPVMLETLISTRRLLATAVITSSGGLFTEEDVGEHLGVARIDATIAKATGRDREDVA